MGLYANIRTRSRFLSFYSVLAIKLALSDALKAQKVITHEIQNPTNSEQCIQHSKCQEILIADILDLIKNTC